MTWVLVAIGVILGALGTLWTLQGLDYLGGSSMSGQTEWAVIGPIVAAVGVALVVVGLRRRGAATRR